MKAQSNLRTLRKLIKQDEQRPERDNENSIPKDNIPKKIGINNQNSDKINEINNENNKLKAKNRKYNEKLSLANKKILELMKEKAILYNNLKSQSEKPWENHFEASTVKDIPGNLRGNARFDEKATVGKTFEENYKSLKSPLTNFGYDAARVNYKDDVLLDEINRNISKGMEFYNL